MKDNVANRGKKVHMNKSKVMISRERQKVMQKAARWPCAVDGRGTGNNSIQCTSCQKWVDRKCSGKLWRIEFKLDGINSGSWHHCLPIRIYH